MVLYQ